MLLRNFLSEEKSEQIFVFDKHTEKNFPTNIKNIASEKGFYDFEDEDISTSLEPALTELESQTAQAFSKIIEFRDLKILTEEDRAWIGIFIASQHVRVKNFREVIKDFDAKMVEKIRDMGGDPDNVEGFSYFKNDDEIKRFSVHFLVKSLPQFSTLMHEKTWVLLETNKKNPFWISDNPVTMHNDLDLGPYGNIGLGVKGIQIYLPLTSTLSLGLWCPTYADQFISAFDGAKKTRAALEAQKVLGRNPDLQQINKQLSELDAAVARLSKLVVPMKEGTPVISSDENMEFFNSLQARWAERFIMSPHNDFRMARRMLRDFPKSKQGMRMTFD